MKKITHMSTCIFGLFYSLSINAMGSLIEGVDEDGYKTFKTKKSPTELIENVCLKLRNFPKVIVTPNPKSDIDILKFIFNKTDRSDFSEEITSNHGCDDVKKLRIF